MLFGLNSTYYKNNRGDILPFGSESNFKPVELGSENGLEMALYFSDKVFGESYSLTREAKPLKPRPPEPYCTFSDTFSYADE